jgi:putative Holliday junction resolvase
VIVLGVDPGERRIGVAVSDPLGVTARPVSTVEHVSLAGDVARVVEIAQSLHAERIVIGHPLNMDGSVGRGARRAGRFANAIRRQSGMNVVLWDERLTTVEAEGILTHRHRVGQELASCPDSRSGRRSAHTREMIDKTAAAVMLQDYLNAQGSAGASCA